MSHTPEPWEPFEDVCIQMHPIHDYQAVYITPEDYIRARACVNACAGLEQEDFDAGWRAKGLSAYASALEVMRDSLESERDTYRELCVDLLNAAKDYCPYLPESQVREGGANMYSSMLRKSCALKLAITKAEKLLGEQK